MIGSSDRVGYQKLDGRDAILHQHGKSMLENGATSVIKGQDDASMVRTRIFVPYVKRLRAETGVMQFAHLPGEKLLANVEALHLCAEWKRSQFVVGENRHAVHE
jgi:hypothetical protein